MDTLTIHFEVEPGTDAHALAPELAERLQELTGVAAAEAEVENERIVVAEAIAVIAGVVLLTKTAREGVDELRKLVTSLTELVRDAKGLKGAVLDFGGRRIPLDDAEKAIAELEASA